MSQKRKRVFSGVQPTGALHIGNYLGAIRNWVAVQEEYESFFCVVDLHAITLPHEPAELAENTRRVAALCIACGIDPRRSTVFVQSHVPAHTELTWLLNCITPLSWLERMTQFKEKALRQAENVGTGLLDYPVLMAADILLYQADLVPVGEDQKQHLELTRDVVSRFNDRFKATDGEPVFKLPDPLILKEGARVMSLLDGAAKMSKSDPSDMSRINLLDDPDLILKKIKRSKTDPERTLEFDNPDRPEAHNLLSLYMVLAGKTKAEVTAECASFRGWADFKPILAETVIAALRPIQARYREIVEDRGYLDGVVKEGRDRAEEIALRTLRRTRDALGFWSA